MIGDSHRNTLAEIWASDARKKVVNDFAAGKYPEVCKGCTFYGPNILK